MAEGPYSRDSFLEGWNTGNAFGYTAMHGQPDMSPPSVLPSATIEKCWKWNLERSRRQSEAGDNIFVPRIMFVSDRSGILSCVVWTDAMPILLPEVDAVLAVRDQLARWRLFRRKVDRSTVRWHDVVAKIAQYRKVEDGLSYHRLDFTSSPDSLMAWFQNLPANSDKLNGVAVDQILDQEIWARAMA